MGERNYEFTGETKTINHPIIGKEVVLYRIIATKDIPYHNIKKGDLGGWIQSYDNLKDNAWVGGDARVYGDAQVYGDALVFENACVYGNTQVYGKAWAYGTARVFGNACVFENARVVGNAKVYGKARVFGDACVYDNSWIFNNAQVYGKAGVYGKAWAYGTARVFGHAKVYGGVRVFSGLVCGSASLDDSRRITNIGAFIKSNNDHCYFSGFGSQNRSTTAYKTKNCGIMVQCGCFNGTLDEFEKRVKETHDNSKYGREYLAIIEVIKIKLGS